MTPGTAPSGVRAGLAPAGTWRAVARGWPVFVPVVVGNAVVQALLVLGDPVAEPDLGFTARVVVSAIAVVLTVAAAAIAALAAVDGRPLTGADTWRRLVPVVGWTVGLGVLAACASLLVVWLGPLVLLTGSLLPAVAAGPGNPVPPAWRGLRAGPVRALVTTLAYLLLVVVGWVIALLLGLLVTGPLAAAATWLWLGLAAVVMLCAWSALLRRGTFEDG